MGLLVLSCIVLLAPGGYAAAQVAGSTTLGVTVEELKAVAIGWSAKRQILGKAVYNEKNVRVGRIDDIIVTPERAVSYVIVGAGGFVGLAMVLHVRAVGSRPDLFRPGGLHDDGRRSSCRG